MERNGTPRNSGRNSERSRRERAAPAPHPRTTSAGAAAALARLQIADLFGSREAQIAQLADEMFAGWAAQRIAQAAAADAMGGGGRGPRRGPRPLSARSLETYRTMWSQYAQFCRSHDLMPQRIDGGMLEEFLRSRRPRTRAVGSPTVGTSEVRSSVQYNFRLLRLIQSVLQAHAARTGEVCSTASAEVLARAPYRWIDRADKQARPEVLREKEVAQLVQVCSLPLGEQHACAPTRWSDVRDNTAALLLLGTGLAPGELRALRTNDVDFGGEPLPARLRVRRGAGGREVRLSQSLSRALAYWLVCRRHLGLAPGDGGPLLVADEGGGPWSEPAMLEAMPRVFARAGIGRQLASRGGYVLRHTFILRALKLRRMTPQDIAWQVGLKDVDKVSARYAGLSLD